MIELLFVVIKGCERIVHEWPTFGLFLCVSCCIGTSLRYDNLHRFFFHLYTRIHNEFTYMTRKVLFSFHHWYRIKRYSVPIFTHYNDNILYFT